MYAKNATNPQCLTSRFYILELLNSAKQLNKYNDIIISRLEGIQHHNHTIKSKMINMEID